MDVFIFILLVISVIVNIALFYLVYNLNRKNGTLSKWIQALALRISEVLNTLDEIDRKGTFKSDDEVGFFFNSLKDTLEILRDYGAIEEETIEEEPRTQQIVQPKI